MHNTVCPCRKNAIIVNNANNAHRPVPPYARRRWLIPVAVIMLVGIAATLIVRGRQTDPASPGHQGIEQAGTGNGPAPDFSTNGVAIDTVVRVDIDDRGRPDVPDG